MAIGRMGPCHVTRQRLRSHRLSGAPVRGLIRVAAPVCVWTAVRLGHREQLSRSLSGHARRSAAERPICRPDGGGRGRCRACRQTGRFETLVARAVGSTRGHVVVASPDYIARRGIPDRPVALAKHDLIFATMHQRPSEWRFGAGKRAAVRHQARQAGARAGGVRVGAATGAPCGGELARCAEGTRLSGPCDQGAATARCDPRRWYAKAASGSRRAGRRWGERSVPRKALLSSRRA